MKLAAKEQECLELKSKLEKINVSFDMQPLMQQPQQDN